MFIIIGVLIGFIAAIPLGPINAFVLSQTLKRGFFHGILAGLTAGVLDIVYCLTILVGFFHLKVNLADILSGSSSLNINLAAILPSLLKLIAAGLLFAIGIRMFLQSRTFSLPVGPQKLGVTSARPAIGVFLLYVCNPTLYFFWFAVAGTMIAHGLLGQGIGRAAVFSLACGIGSMLWYLLIVRYVSNNQHKIKPELLRKLFVVLAVFLAGFALFTIGSLFF